MRTEPTRQVHLDFHTSEHIPGIGSRFRKEQFQKALQLGRVNLINVFAKCHHGWSYYPTERGQPHPHLTCDLLGQQLEACHSIDVKAPIYFTVGWSAHDAEQHPEWCVRTAAGGFVASSWRADATPDTPKPTFQWKLLCPSGDYHKLIAAQTEELCRRYAVDGFWYDIYQAEHRCYCDTCRAGMAAAGLDVDCPEAVERFRAQTIRRHCEALRELIQSYHPEASVYFNGLTQLGRHENARYRLYEVNTKNDLEDLPTTWGGYDKLPLRAKFFHKQGKPLVAMSGKFHTSWGEFGGFKDPAAIRYEAASMIAFGAACNFGDQLHPGGEMDLATYANIGHAYEYVERIEDYGIGGVPTASLGLWLSHEAAADEGAARMLLESQLDFDTVSEESDLSGFEALVIPSRAGVAEAAAERLSAFVGAGGKVLALGEGLLDAGGTRCVLEFDVEYRGPARSDVDYTVVQSALAEGLVTSPFLNYTAALRVAPGPGSEVLASIHEPYFSRTYGKYCGHQNTPYQLDPAEHPAAVRHGNVLWLTHDLDRQYYQHGAKVHRQLFVNALRALGHRPLAEVSLPSAGRISLLHQPERRRYVLHLLYAPPLQRGRCLVIEDLPPLREVPVTLRVPEAVTSLTLIPAGQQLRLSAGQDGVSTVIPEFHCHCAVVAAY